MTVERPYLTLEQAADLAGVSKKRMQNLISEGVLKEHIHFSRPRGLRVRFIREALVVWLEGKDKEPMTVATTRRCKFNSALLSG